MGPGVAGLKVESNRTAVNPLGRSDGVVTMSAHTINVTLVFEEPVLSRAASNYSMHYTAAWSRDPIDSDSSGDPWTLQYHPTWGACRGNTFRHLSGPAAAVVDVTAATLHVLLTALQRRDQL